MKQLKYEYRFFYAIFLYSFLFLVGMLCYLYPLWEKLKLVKLKEEELKQKLALHQGKTNIIPNPFLKNYKMALSHLLALALAQKIKVAAIKTDSKTHFQLNLFGDYKAFQDFFINFHEESQGLGVGNFLLEQKDPQQLRLQIDFMLLETFLPVKKMTVKNLAKTSPFCTPDYLFSHANEKLSLDETPLTQMKMVGYLEKAQEKIAFILLPHFGIVGVREGIQIGKEKAFITAIYPNRLKLQLQNQQFLILTM